jgi:hypothetical protein
MKFNDDNFKQNRKKYKKKVVALIFELMFIRNKKLGNNFLNSERMEENSKIKKAEKNYKMMKIQIKKNFFLLRAFNFTNREQNIYFPANLSKKDRKRAIKSAK